MPKKAKAIPATVPEVQAVDPLATLKEYAKSLEAAMTLVLAEPDKGAVHKLRSTTRRLEAQVSLLAELGALPKKGREAKKLRKRTKKVRRTAGEVRDLDVLHGMLKDEPLVPQHDLGELLGDMEKDRARKAEKLQALLLGHLPKVVAAVEQLVAAVDKAKAVDVPAADLVPLIERWRQAQPDGGRPGKLDDEHLHSTRKVAKAARYMAETLPDVPEAVTAAARYEAVQDAGGRWHDWLQLAAIARGDLGKRHAITVAAAEQTEVARAAFLATLDQEGG